MTNRILSSVLLCAVVATLPACSGDEPTTPAQQPDTGTTQPQPPATPPMLATIEKTGDPAIDALADFVAAAKIDLAKPDWRATLPKPPQVEFADGKTWYWNLTTNQGPLRIKLRPDAAPMHVSSTIYLTKLGYYDGLAFHRVMKGFMAQGGDPLGNGTGGPGYEYDGEFKVRCRHAECGHEFFGTKQRTILGNLFFVCPKCEQPSAPLLTHDRAGVLSWANAGPGTDGSQFFLTFKPTPGLDGKHTVVGQVVDGLDTLSAMEAIANPKDGPPLQPVTLTRATISVE